MNAFFSEVINVKGKDLKILRIQNDKKAIDVCLAAGISPSKLSLIEREYKECPKELYEKLVEIINK